MIDLPISNTWQLIINTGNDDRHPPDCLSSFKILRLKHIVLNQSGSDIFSIGDEVAVMPKNGDVVAIDTVAHVDQEFVWLKEGGVYRLPAGDLLSKPGTAYIVRATNTHYSAIGRKKPR